MSVPEGKVGDFAKAGHFSVPQVLRNASFFVGELIVRSAYTNEHIER